MFVGFIFVMSLSLSVISFILRLSPVAFIIDCSFKNNCFITVRNEVAKVMFLQLSVCPQGGVCLSACWDTTPPGTRHPPGSRHTHPGISPPLPQSRHPPGPGPPPPREQTPPTGADGYRCGRYASYWNAFLFFITSVICLLAKRLWRTFYLSNFPLRALSPWLCCL